MVLKLPLYFRPLNESCAQVDRGRRPAPSRTEGSRQVYCRDSQSAKPNRNVRRRSDRTAEIGEIRPPIRRPLCIVPKECDGQQEKTPVMTRTATTPAITFTASAAFARPPSGQSKINSGGNAGIDWIGARSTTAARNRGARSAGAILRISEVGP